MQTYSPDDLVHITNWPQYLSYVSPSKKHSATWRPPQFNLHALEFEELLIELTDSALASFIRLVFEYGSCPLRDPSEGPLSARRCTFARATKSLRLRGKHASQTWEALIHAGLVSISSADCLPRERQDRSKTGHDPTGVRQDETGLEGVSTPQRSEDSEDPDGSGSELPPSLPKEPHEAERERLTAVGESVVPWQ